MARAFDTLAASERPQAAGVEGRRAEAVAEAIAQAGGRRGTVANDIGWIKPILGFMFTFVLVVTGFVVNNAVELAGIAAQLDRLP